MRNGWTGLSLLAGVATGVLAGHAGAQGVGDPCTAAITSTGCCDQATVRFCQDGTIQELDCTQAETTCGWNPDQDYYDCGGAGEDPTGAAPFLCPGGTCTPSCANRECGSDGCTGTCGSCGEGTTCVEGRCEAAIPCGPVTFTGCCDGSTLKFCEDGALQVLACAQNPEPDDVCGWKATDAQGGPANWYDCGGHGADPSGQAPLACPIGTPDSGPDVADAPDAADAPEPSDAPTDGSAGDAARDEAGDVAAPDHATIDAPRDLVRVDPGRTDGGRDPGTATGDEDIGSGGGDGGGCSAVLVGGDEDQAGHIGLALALLLIGAGIALRRSI